MGLQSSWIPVFLAAMAALGETAVGAGDVATSDVCLNDGLDLQCISGYVVHVQSATCGDGGSACPLDVESVLLRLCDGRVSCAGLGLRNVFTVHCHSSEERANSLVVNFTCEPEPEPPPACRTNLCSDHSHGLRCAEDSVLHVRKLTCLDGLEPCLWATYVTLYSLCESRTDCDSSGLRMLMPAYCNTSAPQLRNVFVDYLCVPNDMVYSQCSGEYQTLDKPFGLLMNPPFMGQGPGAALQCRWLLSPGHTSRRVVVTVHVAHIKWGSPNCTDTFLQVRYKDCDTLHFTTKHFCDLRQVNTPLTSCGPVEVRSELTATYDQADRFLVSYQILDKDEGDVTPANLSVCSTPLVTPPPSTPRQTTRAAQTGRNYGPAATMFDYSDTIRHTGDDTSRTDGNSSPVTLQFKLLVLYVFFGLVIIALVIALIYVLVSYHGISHGISRRKRPRGDSSEKDALWRQDETPLDTFNPNSHNSLADLNAPSPATTPDAARSHVVSSSPDSQVEATVHMASGDQQHKRFSTGSGFSSFLSARDSAFWSSTNPYANVGDFDIDVLASRDGVSSVHCADKDRQTAQRFWGNGYTGQQRNSALSHSPMTSGDLGDIYESVDHHKPLPPCTSMQNDDSRESQEFSDTEDPAMERVPLMGQPANSEPPPSPPFPPPPPPLFLEDPESGAAGVPHFVVNEDEYAVVSKTRYPSSTTSSPGSHPAAEYSNLLCLAHDDSGHSRSDPAYLPLNTFREDSVPVVDFRPASGPYDRDRTRDLHTSPTTGGSRHQWNDDL